jgi:demethylmenaquinone methyltransferase/2-methoxy-6-polyprenyl-1,4-benzoquinol methylase
VREYYDRRAAEYDDWYRGTGLYAELDRPGWDDEVAVLCAALAALPRARTLDVACGTGFLTRHLPGEITALDQSPAMLREARRQAPGCRFVQGEAIPLPFADGEFERIVTGHFYGHLDEDERVRFLAEARRVAPELVVIDSALREGVASEERQQRRLTDGSTFEVYKRYFTAEALAAELGGGETLHAGRWFVAVRSRA